LAEKSKATAKAAPAGKADSSAKKKVNGKATPPVTDGPKCREAKCKQPVRAKGYCRKHFIAWRRGEVGNKHQYKICSKEGCRKPRAHGGLCEEHSGKGAPAEGAAA
jgi:hypothetical protein